LKFRITWSTRSNFYQKITQYNYEGSYPIQSIPGKPDRPYFDIDLPTFWPEIDCENRTFDLIWRRNSDELWSKVFSNRVHWAWKLKSGRILPGKANRRSKWPRFLVRIFPPIPTRFQFDRILTFITADYKNWPKIDVEILREDFRFFST